MVLLEMFGGMLWFVVASIFYWKLGPKDGMSPQWVKVPGMDLVVVFVVLGGWALGAAFVLHGAIALFLS